MLEVGIKYNEIESQIYQPFKRQIRFALSHAINKTLPAVRKDQQAYMKESGVLDKDPNRWTLSSVAYKKSTKTNLTGLVYFQDEYTALLMNGGTRLPLEGNKRIIAKNPTAKRFTTSKGRLSKTAFEKAKAQPKKFFFGGLRKKSRSGYALWERMSFVKGKSKTALGNKRKPNRVKHSQSIRLIVSLSKKTAPQKKKLFVKERSRDFILKRIDTQIKASIRYAIRNETRSIQRAYTSKFL